MEMINFLSPYGPREITPKKVIVHAMAECLTYDGVRYHAKDYLYFSQLSAHILVCPDGTLTRCRSDKQGAWHALGHNYDSLGIEFLVPGYHTYASFVEAIKMPYLTSQQYAAGVEFVHREWVEKLGLLHYKRHSDVSPDRKVDPGTGFPWNNFLEDIGVVV